MGPEFTGRFWPRFRVAPPRPVYVLTNPHGLQTPNPRGLVVPPKARKAPVD